jgi:very-short-patch-repair endonuclease
MLNNRPILKARRKELRNNSTPAEKRLWKMLQHSSLGGYKFRRQHSVGFFILDF